MATLLTEWRGVLTIARRELGAYLESPGTWLAIGGWMAASTVALGAHVLDFSELSGMVREQAAGDPSLRALVDADLAVIVPLLRAELLLALILVPLLSMHLLAGEGRRGTLELLLSAPRTTGGIVLGKFLAVLVVLLIPMVLTAASTWFLFAWASPDFGLFLSGHLGLFTAVAFFAAVGVLGSSCFDLPFPAACLSFGLLLATILPGWLLGDDAALSRVSVLRRASAFVLGRFALGDVVFFLGLSSLVLFLASRRLESRRWR
ncbi:MAG: ABC transporter permease subunit [Acidobacteriota bacterium]